MSSFQKCRSITIQTKKSNSNSIPTMKTAFNTFIINIIGPFSERTYIDQPYHYILEHTNSFNISSSINIVLKNLKQHTYINYSKTFVFSY